ncbi:hypothetical protein [Spirosoma telluris]|uniref:hypothetical protein n=1 Tax=Spirosoma telluris TaxID=2183553 RepID=UPI002FC349A0
MKISLYALSLLALFSCSGKEKSTQETRSGSSKSTADIDTLQPPVALSDKPSPTKGAVTGADTWHYEKTTDREGKPVYKASITSPNLIKFGFPYAGGPPQR